MNTIKIECRDCKGTGLYIGFAERDGAAVICQKCNGTGGVDFRYKPFLITNPIEGVKRVYRCNPGIQIGCGKQFTLEDFGGLSYEEWEQGKPFANGTEMRKFTCPAWFYQQADYKRKPNWDECNSMLGGRFSECKHFSTKEKCWARFDENKL